jgi:hypothetical protein
VLFVPPVARVPPVAEAVPPVLAVVPPVVDWFPPVLLPPVAVASAGEQPSSERAERPNATTSHGYEREQGKEESVMSVKKA